MWSYKSGNIGEYLDYENCKCRKKIADKLIDECTETIEEVKLANITIAENKNNYKYGSCNVYIVFTIVVFIIIGLWLKIMFLALNLVLAKKQRFGKCNSIECNFIDWIYKWEK